jgi:heme/copper-type cytochrome/quinol oxidase subunit 2
VAPVIITFTNPLGSGVRRKAVRPMSTRVANGALICGAMILGLLLSACTAGPGPGSSASPPTAVSSPSEPSSPAASPPSVPASSPSLNADYALTININISNGKTVPNGEKINVRVGQKVILNVTSDTDDQIHAHIGGEGYELAVRAGTPAKGSFTIESPGSFEVESHHLEKIIVILNAR